MMQRVNAPGNQSSQGARPESRHFHRNFWATTGVATIVAAIIGAVATLLAAKAPDEHPKVLPTSAQTQANESATPPAAPTDAGIFWKGTFHFDSYVDFDTAPPRNGGGLLSQYVDGTLDASNSASKWVGAKLPTRDECAEGVATQAEAKIPLEIGAQVCYQTPAGRIVYFKVLKILEHGSLLTNPRFQVKVVVWQR